MLTAVPLVIPLDLFQMMFLVNQRAFGYCEYIPLLPGFSSMFPDDCDSK
jgi:hypothetical protein